MSLPSADLEAKGDTCSSLQISKDDHGGHCIYDYDRKSGLDTRFVLHPGGGASGSDCRSR